MANDNPYASPESFGEGFGRAAEAFGKPAEDATTIFAEGVLTERDYVRSIKLYYRWGWYLARVLVLVMSGVYVWFLYVLFRPNVGGGGWQGFLLTRAPLLVIVVIGAVLLWTRQDARLRRNWRKAPLREEPFTLRITPDVFEVRRASAYVLLRWSSFRTQRVYGDELMILTSAHTANQMHVFPRRIFSDHDWDRFVKLVTERLPRG